MTRRSPLPILAAALVASSAAVAGCVPDARSAEGPGGTPSGEASEGERPGGIRSAEVSLVRVVERLEACAEADPGARTTDRPGVPIDAATGRSTGCLHLVYVVSPSMPLSGEGIPEIAQAAGDLGMALSVVRETALLEPAREARAEALRTALVDAGATVHYPSLALLADGRVRGTALVGYKRADAWEALLRERLGSVEESGPGPTVLPGRSGTNARPASPQEIEVVWTHGVEPSPGAFFRRIPGTSYISFDQRRAVHIRDLATGEQFRGPGWIDFVPTPDGRLFVTPGEANSGLEFYVVEDVLERGPAGTAVEMEPFLRDGEMNDQYPSVGILREDVEAGRTRYRILVSWFRGLAFRDYDVHWADAGPPEVEAVTDKLAACPGLDLSIPILSKDGREVAARDGRTGTTRIFRLNDDATCTEVLDLGRRTSKVGFSDDGVLVAYSSPEPSSGLSGVRSWTYVLDRNAMETVRVPHTESAGLVIPELVGTDSLLVAVKESARSRGSEFRLLCCVR